MVTTSEASYPAASASPEDGAILKKSEAIRMFCDRWEAENADVAMVHAMGELRRQSGQMVPPIALEQGILPRINARPVRTPMSPRGRLQADANGWVIHIPPDAPWATGRFTIAHELSHVLLFDAVSSRRDLIDQLRNDDALWWPIERLCDRGAAELLLPEADMRQMLGSEFPQTSKEARKLFHRYLVSASAFMRRIRDIGENRSYTTWEYRSYRAKPEAWRITEVDSNLPKQTRTYLPKHLSSRSHLMPDLVEEASRTGFAYAKEAALTTGSQRHTGCMFAFNPSMPDEAEPLPTFEGTVVPYRYSPTIHLLIDHRSIGPISRRTRFG